jgi:protein tyrosine/serine phosphatase
MSANPTDLQVPTVPNRRKPSVLVWVIASILCGLAVWYICDNAGKWKDRFVPRKLRTVEAGQIYASGQIDRHLLRQVLVDDHIKVIVSLVSDDPTDADVAAEMQAANELGIQRYIDPLDGDGTGDIHSYANAITQIAQAQKENRPVLVHCSSGAQRSNGATYYYRVLVQHWNADDAAREMTRNGHSSKSNPALIPYLNSHIREMAGLLVQNGVIDQIPDPLPQIQHD